MGITIARSLLQAGADRNAVNAEKQTVLSVLPGDSSSSLKAQWQQLLAGSTPAFGGRAMRRTDESNAAGKPLSNMNQSETCSHCDDELCEHRIDYNYMPVTLDDTSHPVVVTA